ncbi:MAG TPA: YceH family protein [Terriglobia bacterium]|nr:YceH family protein [Terriglobia bacterium]
MRADTVIIQLNQVEARVLGSLMEKEATTPDYYPLSLNALVNACNQKSNREPVMDLDEVAVHEALDSLDEKGLARAMSLLDSRVTKYGHRLQEVFNFDRRETAILCVLLLRGPQTPGELRTRGERLYRFEDLDSVELALNRLIERDPPLVKKLPRLPGTKESRYAHLLCGDVEGWEPPPESSSAPSAPRDDERLTRLENEVVNLQQEVADLKRQLADFQKQFE